MEIAVPGFRDFGVRLTEGGARGSGHVRLAGSPYFIYLEFVRREDGSLRERLFGRRVETFCGKAVRAKVGPQLEDLADAASEAALTALAA